MKLLNPGPVSTSNAVRQALLTDDLCHREVECEQLLADVCQRIESIYDDCSGVYKAILLTGSGTAAVEAMLASCVRQKDSVLMVANGIYGYRMEAILERYKKRYELLDFGLTGEIDFVRVEAKLSSKRFTQVAFVHNETTIGRLNDFDKMADLCNRYNVKLMVDGVSSFGGEAINFKHDCLLAVAATANKCLHGFPGISFVMVKEAMMPYLEGNSSSLYLDLFNHYQSQIKNKVAFTPAVQILYALQAALIELEQQGGWQARHDYYLKLSTALRESFAKNGVLLAIPEAQCASMLSAFRLPEGSDFDALHKYYKDNGYVIYPGQLNLGGTIFRIATMGTLTLVDMTKLADLMNNYVMEGISNTCKEKY
jgi:2-aminoethylphosphonate-pyruvate transaminase